jgi:hypothetical protein
MSTAYLKSPVNRWKHCNHRAALMVVGCIIDLLANRKLRHQEQNPAAGKPSGNL